MGCSQAVGGTASGGVTAGMRDAPLQKSETRAVSLLRHQGALGEVNGSLPKEAVGLKDFPGPDRKEFPANQ